MPETPNQADLLSDLLGRMHLSGVVLFRTEFCEPWGLVSPAACELSRMLPFRTEHIIPFHIIAEGGCWLELKDREPVWLEAGDAVLLPYGDMHVLHGRKAAVAVPAEQLLPPPPWPDILRIRHGGDGECTRIVCGFVQCDELLFHPLLRHLPALMHVSPGRDPDDAWLAGTIRHTAQEATRADPGGRSMLPRLTELMFVEILRQHMQALAADEVGWFAAVNDPVVGTALKWLHAAPLDDWNVDRLARRVGVSRTALAARFKHFLDMPPMHYLTYWRLQLAAQRLKATDAPMKGIADQAGYESEAAFSRA
ncbi:MAG TPA: AraC family transcriptional regulator, partial [Steroidobacteraceae bacterium]|nr:AraC family transcriptional regulator [Steroidobacteraceae bacterium]